MIHQKKFRSLAPRLWITHFDKVFWRWLIVVWSDRPDEPVQRKPYFLPHVSQIYQKNTGTGLSTWSSIFLSEFSIYTLTSKIDQNHYDHVLKPLPQACSDKMSSSLMFLKNVEMIHFFVKIFRLSKQFFGPFSFIIWYNVNWMYPWWKKRFLVTHNCR